MLNRSDPFRLLDLDRTATADDVRRARRELAKRIHPDAGGDADQMRRINIAAADALRIIADSTATTSSSTTSSASPAGSAPAPSGPFATAGWTAADAAGRRRDAPSFTVEALPVETFEALLLAGAELGEVVEDDPPYLLTALLAEPLSCWSRLDVVPDAGASTVSVTIGQHEGPDRVAPLPPIEAVRDAWITALNGLDWDQLS